jgi:hypothetical protein
MSSKESVLRMFAEADKGGSARISWPFQSMGALESAFFPLSGGEFDAHKAQSYCHIYGRQAGKEFMTKTITNQEGIRGIMIARTK